jgi:hypothetical protein
MTLLMDYVYQFVVMAMLLLHKFVMMEIRKVGMDVLAFVLYSSNTIVSSIIIKAHAKNVQKEIMLIQLLMDACHVQHQIV